MMEKLIKKLNNRKGFTLIELIVVIAIIGILAAILIPQFTGFSDKARLSGWTQEARTVQTALASYYTEEGNEATSSSALGAYIEGEIMDNITALSGGTATYANDDYSGSVSRGGISTSPSAI